ncbi:hypothetical protein RJ40_05385 [Methanofollis aquaemaris]|uniref:PGF-pre-PGF domain-containing protein n=1 Tax=Methanofollis aquaemaris TaxID=126734 RepID=A0A8A3S5R7_9EURY|nr:hypothetical protein [Methanofollis aquaemaris]QSZ66964.1 hypothetical protein RJ40_05385 [Methanofollis aquaemaris]
MKTWQSIAVLLLLCGLVAGAAAADGGVPVFPHEFKGSVTIDGSPAPADIEITAVLGGETYGPVTTAADGTYGGSTRHAGEKLLVLGTDDLAGETITFLVDGETAKETATFTPKGTSRVDLSVGSGDVTPTPKPNPPSSGGSGGGGGPSPVSNPPAPTATQTTSVERASLLMTKSGELTESVTVRTGDGVGSVTLREGTVARDRDGEPLGEVTVKKAGLTGTPPIPPGTTVGFALSCGPAGATFDPPITLTYTLSAEEWEEIGDPATLTVMWYNPESGAWQEVPATIDPATRTVTARVSHFSLFALSWATPESVAASADRPAATVTTIGPDEPQPAPTAGETPWALIGAGGLLLLCTLAVGGYVMWRQK